MNNHCGLYLEKKVKFAYCAVSKWNLLEAIYKSDSLRDLDLDLASSWCKLKKRRFFKAEVDLEHQVFHNILLVFHNILLVFYNILQWYKKYTWKSAHTFLKIAYLVLIEVIYKI